MRAIEHRKARSNTGLPGITLTKRLGRPCYTVSWRAAKGVRKCTTIYFRGEPERELALEKAVTIRRSAITARYASERATTFRDGNKAKKGTTGSSD